VQRLDKTVNDLLFFGKPSLPEFACIDINYILDSTCKFASQHRSVVNIEKRINLAPDLPTVYADGKQMQQVFLNLFLNAFQAMAGGGTLTITTGSILTPGSRICYHRCADTGPGIPPQILEKIFTPFLLPRHRVPVWGWQSAAS